MSKYFYFDEDPAYIYYNEECDSGDINAAYYSLIKKHKNNSALEFLFSLVDPGEDGYGSWRGDVLEDFDALEQSLSEIPKDTEEGQFVHEVVKDFLKMRKPVEEFLATHNVHFKSRQTIYFLNQKGKVVSGEARGLSWEGGKNCFLAVNVQPKKGYMQTLPLADVALTEEDAAKLNVKRQQKRLDKMRAEADNLQVRIKQLEAELAT